MERRKTTWVLIVLLATGSHAFADMMPVSGLDGTDQSRAPLAVSSTCARMAFPCPATADVDPVYLNAGSRWFLPPLSEEAPSGSVSLAPKPLADGQGNLGLCLYALVGLGLFHSVPLAKKFRFSHVPDWYHSGGPAQIGHSLLMAPDCLSPAPLCGFIQPDDTEVDRLPQYFRGTLLSLLQRSRYTPTPLPSRGPPSPA